MFVSIDLLGPQEKIFSFAQLNKTRKRRSKHFLHLKMLAFFWRLCVFNNLLGPRKCSYKFQSSCQNSSWTPIKSSLIFVTLEDTRKNGPKTFVFVETAKFWNVCFYRLLRSRANDLIICTKNVKKPFGPLLSLFLVPWRFLCSIKREKLGQSFFFTYKILPLIFEDFVFSTTS